MDTITLCRRALRNLFCLVAACGLIATAVGQTVDTDRDNLADAQDNCPTLANPDQRDSDADGRGNLCDGDFNNDGKTDAADLDLLRSVLNKPATASPLAAAADMDGDGLVTATDLSRIRATASGTVAVAPPPVVAQTGTVNWVGVAGGASDVGVGANGAVWVIGRTQVPGGFDIHRRDGDKWTQIPGGALRIAVDPQGNAWVVNSAQTIFRWDGSKWLVVNGRAFDIGIGANGAVWAIGNNPEAGGYGIYRTTDKGANWTKIPGSATRISVDPAGNAWVVNSTNIIYRYDGAQWLAMPGRARDVGVGVDGAVWVTGTDGGIYRFENANWVKKSGGAAQIAAGPNGVVWAVNDTGAIYQAQVGGGSSGTSGQAILITGAAGSAIDIASPTAAPNTGTQPVNPVIQSGGTFMVGPAGTSYATCGVFDKGLCKLQPASLVRNASITCPAGSFPDLGKSSCWSCPQGYTRSTAAVDGQRACQKPDASVQGGYLTATFQGPRCESPSFFDPIREGSCYTCPPGMDRSAAHIDAPNACWIPAHEEFGAALWQNKGMSWDCKAPGSFWDPNGNCYTCPAGLVRTAYAVTDARACARYVPDKVARAQAFSKAECGPGEFYDPKIPGQQNFATGGGCWTCPVATDRTVFPVDQSQACQRAPGLAFTTATKTMAMTCEATEIFDPINSNNSSVTNALNVHNAEYPKAPITAAGSGGTCWTCPPGHERTQSPVYGSSACLPPGVVWKAAPYNQPGLFGLRKAEQVALKLVTERTLINTIIRDMETNPKFTNKPPNFAQAAWDEIGTSPQDSAILKMAVLSRVVAAATNPASATQDEQELLADVVKQVTAYRVFIAKNAQSAYWEWKENQSYRDGLNLSTQATELVRRDDLPPDFEGMTAQAIMGGLAAGGASSVAIGLAITSDAAFKQLFPYSVRLATKIGEELAEKVIATALKEAAKQAAYNTVKAAVSGALSIASIGPQVIVMIGTEFLAIAIEQEIDKANAPYKLETSVATASQPVDFKRLTATPEGTAQSEAYWASLMAGPARRPDGNLPPQLPPVYLQAFTQQAATAKLAIN